MKISIILRAFNEEKHIGKLLHEISKQKTKHSVEIVLVDSGSTDRTIEIANQYDVHLVKISPKDFTFGYSLNKGIEECSGDICLITSAHCYPCDESWINNMVAPFENNKVAMVYGRQIGGKETVYSEHRIFHRWFPDYDVNDGDLAFCNNANSAIRKSIWETYKFDEQLSGLEDLDWAKYVKKKSYQISYVAKACVHHIHEQSASQVYTRYYREALAYRQIYKNEHFSFFDFIRFFLMNLVGDYLHAIKDRSLVQNIISIPLFRIQQFWGTYRAHQFKVSIHRAMKRRLYYPDRPRFFGEQSKNISVPVRKKSNSYIDITRTVDEGLVCWPGTSCFSRKLIKTIKSNNVQDTTFEMNAHCGTHIDAPSHFIEGAKDLDGISIDRFFGKTLVVDYFKDYHISPDFLRKIKIPKGITKLLFRTRNSMNSSEDFNKNFIAITKEAANWLVDNSIETVGIDGPSIQPFFDEDDTHKILLKNEVIILENLDLSKVTPNSYYLTFMPLKIRDIEASPVRAILKEVK